MSNNDDERPDNLRIFHVGNRQYGIFHDGVYLATVDYETAKPLMLQPAARRLFMAEHGIQAGDQRNGA
jgi:hypothetical protein